MNFHVWGTVRRQWAETGWGRRESDEKRGVERGRCQMIQAWERACMLCSMCCKSGAEWQDSLAQYMKSWVVCKHHKVFMPDLSSESLWTVTKMLALLGLIFSTSKIKVQNDMLKQVISNMFRDSTMHSHTLYVILVHTKNIKGTDLWTAL